MAGYVGCEPRNRKNYGRNLLAQLNQVRDTTQMSILLDATTFYGDHETATMMLNSPRVMANISGSKFMSVIQRFGPEFAKEAHRMEMTQFKNTVGSIVTQMLEVPFDKDNVRMELTLAHALSSSPLPFLRIETLSFGTVNLVKPLARVLQSPIATDALLLSEHQFSAVECLDLIKLIDSVVDESGSVPEKLMILKTHSVFGCGPESLLFLALADKAHRFLAWAIRNQVGNMQTLTGEKWAVVAIKSGDRLLLSTVHGCVSTHPARFRVQAALVRREMENGQPWTRPWYLPTKGDSAFFELVKLARCADAETLTSFVDALDARGKTWRVEIARWMAENDRETWSMPDSMEDKQKALRALNMDEVIVTDGDGPPTIDTMWLTALLHQSAGTSDLPPNVFLGRVFDGVCVACDKAPEVVLDPCGHASFCRAHFNEWKKRRSNNECPECRGPGGKARLHPRLFEDKVDVKEEASSESASPRKRSRYT